MEGKDWTILVVSLVVVAVLASLITVNMTGNVINVAKGKAGKVYTTAEIDAKLKNLSSAGSCKYIYFYMSEDPKFAPILKKTARQVCKIAGNYSPQAIGFFVQNTLYRRAQNNTVQGCDNSNQIFGESNILLGGQDGDGFNQFDVTLGSLVNNGSNNCYGNMGLNKEFESKTVTNPISVLCCSP